MNKKQKGTTTVEFAIVGALFFIILFGIIEIGRALFVWNGLADVTRRAARIAAVCPPNDTDIVRTAIYNSVSNSGESSVYSGLQPAHVRIQYLSSTMALVANPATTGFVAVKFVQASINGYEHQLLIPFFDLNLIPPDFSTTVTAESLGRWQDVAGNEFNDCYIPN